MRMYTVVILFAYGGTKTMLVRKDGNCYHGRYNGFGGEIKPNELHEDYADNAYRKVKEEANVDLIGLTYLGLLSIPEGDDTASVAFYAACLTNDQLMNEVYKASSECQEKMCLFDTSDIIGSTLTDDRFAGDGDLQYFVARGLRMLGLSAEE